MNLMTSALYQRYVWSINEPLIGIELMGRYARVYLGWLDYDCGYEQSVSMRYWFYFIYSCCQKGSRSALFFLHLDA